MANEPTIEPTEITTSFLNVAAVLSKGLDFNVRTSAELLPFVLKNMLTRGPDSCYVARQTGVYVLEKEGVVLYLTPENLLFALAADVRGQITRGPHTDHYRVPVDQIRAALEGAPKFEIKAPLTDSLTDPDAYAHLETPTPDHDYSVTAYSTVPGFPPKSPELQSLIDLLFGDKKDCAEKLESARTSGDTLNLELRFLNPRSKLSASPEKALVVPCTISGYVFETSGHHASYHVDYHIIKTDFLRRLTVVGNWKP